MRFVFLSSTPPPSPTYRIIKGLHIQTFFILLYASFSCPYFRRGRGRLLARRALLGAWTDVRGVAGVDAARFRDVGLCRFVVRMVRRQCPVGAGAETVRISVRPHGLRPTVAAYGCHPYRAFQPHHTGGVVKTLFGEIKRMQASSLRKPPSQKVSLYKSSSPRSTLPWMAASFAMTGEMYSSVSVTADFSLSPLMR